MRLLLDQLSDIADPHRKASFVSTIALVVPEPGSTAFAMEHVVEGRWHGRLATEPRGDGGFGYDPIFIPDGQEAGAERTVGQWSPEEKTAASHRAQAFIALAPLLSALKAKRRALAEEARVPAYVIFTDRTLIEMAETRPETLDQMARVSGVGAKKLDRYGNDFLQIIAGEAAAPVHPARMKLAGRAEGEVYDRLLQARSWNRWDEVLALARRIENIGRWLPQQPAVIDATFARAAALAPLRGPAPPPRPPRCPAAPRAAPASAPPPAGHPAWSASASGDPPPAPGPP